MKKLIEALQIFAKYKDLDYPTHCEHDVLYVVEIDENVSEEDAKRLDELGFIWTDDGWISYRYGSA